jgi:hypothetical protein
MLSERILWNLLTVRLMIVPFASHSLIEDNPIFVASEILRRPDALEVCTEISPSRDGILFLMRIKMSSSVLKGAEKRKWGKSPTKVEWHESPTTCRCVNMATSYHPDAGWGLKKLLKLRSNQMRYMCGGVHVLGIGNVHLVAKAGSPNITRSYTSST